MAAGVPTTHRSHDPVKKDNTPAATKKRGARQISSRISSNEAFSRTHTLLPV